MAGGTGNLILKRGTTTPLTAQHSATISLINGMPAVQIMGVSRPSNSAGNASGPFAYDNYPNRLWVGVEGYGSTSSEAGTGPGGTISSIAYSLPSGANNRSLWMGAEIRADAAVYATGDSNSSTPPDSPVVMQADWTNASDYVLVTQKAIKSWATSTFGSSGSVTATSSNTASTVYPLFVDTVGSSTTLLADNSTTALSYVPSTGTLTIAGDLAVNGGDITTTSNGTATLFNSNATTLSMGGAATQINLGGTAPTVTISSGKSGSPTLAFNCATDGTVTISSDATTGRGDIFTNITTGTINLGSGITTGTTNVATGGASTTNIGGAGGNVNIGTTSGNSTLTIRGNSTTGIATLATNSGVTTANVFNTNATTLNMGGAATTVSIGSSSGNTTINNNAIVTGDLAVNGSTSADITTATTTASLFNTTATTVNIGGGATIAVNVGNNSGIVAVPGDLKIGGGATTKTVQLFEASGNGSQYVGVKSPDSVASSYTLTLPDAPSGTSGYALVASGTSGALTWASTGNASTVSGTEVSDNAEYNLVLGPLALSAGTIGLSIDSSDGITYNPSTDKLTMTGDLAVNGGDITTTTTAATVFNSTATTVSVGGGASTLNLGYINGSGVTAGQTINIGTNSSTSGAKIINIGSNSNTAGATTLNVLGGSTGNITVNLGTNATTGTSNVNLGSTSASGGSTVTVNNDLVVGGNLTVNGITTTINATTVSVDDKNIELGSLGAATVTGLVGSVGNISGSGPWTADYTLSTANNNIKVGGTLIHISGTNGTTLYGGTPTSVVVTAVSGNVVSYEVTGGTIPTAGTGNAIASYGSSLSQTPSNTSADGGGITLKGTTDKTFNWVNSTSAWTSSENMDLASGKAYYINGTSVLNATTLGSGVTGSSLTSVGTLTGGTWNANVIGMTYGGTGKNLTPVAGGLVYTDVDSMEVLAAGTSGYVLKSNGSSAPTWVDPTTLSSGAASSITVRTETTTTNNTKYPIPFLGSSSVNSPASSWSGLSADGNSVTAYLFTDATSTALASTPSSPTNSSTGLFYEVSDGSNAIGTLYCDYIGATLDCGTYS